MNVFILIAASIILFAKPEVSNISDSPFAFSDTFKIPAAETLNVKDFGAIGDDKHDDGPAIQAALNKAESLSAAVVFIPNGVYLVANPGNGDSGKGKYGLRIGSNITLQLSDKAVLHKSGNEEVVSNKDWEKGNSNICITGGTFKTHSGTDQPWAPTRTGIKFVNVSNSSVKKSRFVHIGNSGVTLERSSNDNVVSNCYFTDIYNCGVTADGKRNRILNNKLENMGSDGILMNGFDCLVMKNILKNIGSYSAPSLGSSISLGVDNHTCSGNRVIGNIISGGAAYGIINDGSSSTLIKGNTIRNTGSSGIKIGGGGFKSVVQSNIISNTGNNTNMKGIYIHTGILVDGKNITVSNNTISDVIGTAIYITGTASDATIKSCKIKRTKHAGENDVEGAGIQVKAGNAQITNCQTAMTAGDAIVIAGSINNVKVKKCTLNISGEKYAFRIDGTKDAKPSKIVISDCKTPSGNGSGNSIVKFGEDITFQRLSRGKVVRQDAKNVRQL